MSNDKSIIAVTALQQRTIPVLLLAIVIFMQMLDATILNTALPTIAEDFGISPLSMQSVIISCISTCVIHAFKRFFSR